jgi:Sulfotransferase family
MDSAVTARLPGGRAGDTPVTDLYSYPSLAPEGLEPLALDVALPGPNVIGATGGSGTRIVARVLRSTGMFIGERRNDYEDALDLGAYSDRWVNAFMTAGATVSEKVLLDMSVDLRAVLGRHLAHVPEGAVAWGWKEPRSIYLLPFYDAVLPSFRFLHFVRDGRDMAFSDNQQQLKKHGRAVIDRSRLPWRRPLDSIKLWTRVNLMAADYGEHQLAGRYLRIRFEDLCTDPGPTAERIARFFGLTSDAGIVAEAEVQPPSTLGRWQAERERIVDRLVETAGPALTRFGYLD